MPTNIESLNNSLYRMLSKYKPKPLDVSGEVTPIPDEADVIKFTFTKDGEDYGTVYTSIDEDRTLTVYFDDDVGNSPEDKTPGLDYDDTWSGLLHQLSAFRMTKGLKRFDTRNRDQVNDDMARRKHMRNKDKIAEGYYPMGKKASYSDAVPSVKIVIEHSRVIEEGEQRYRNINRIFLENQLGERYLLDTKKPGIARVYARHIAEGGKVNDDRWNHVHSLCEEYSKMAGFVRATRNGQFNESAQSLVNEGIAHYQSLRESLSRMTGKRGYNAYFESWTPALMETEGDETNLNELFVQETLDPRIESVMPILSRIHKKVSESVVDKEMNKLAEWADSLVEEESIKSNNPVGIPEEENGSESFGGFAESEGRQEIGQLMADDGITYSAEKENEIIGKMIEYMKKSGMDSKQIRYLLNYDEDYVADQLSHLPKEGMDESSFKQTSGQRQYGVLHSQLKSLANSGQINTPAGKQKAEKMIDTIQQLVDTDPSCAGSTVPSKKIWLSEQGMAEGSVTPDVTVNKVHDDGHEKEWHIYRGKEMIGYVIKNQPDTAEGLYIAYGHGPGRAFVEEFAGLKPAVNYIASLKEGVSEGDGNPDIQPGMKVSQGTVVKVDGNTVTVKTSNGDMITMNIHDVDQAVAEDLDANQKRVGQLGPTEKVGPKGAVGKLVGANENFINMDAQSVTTEDEMDEGTHTQHDRDLNPNDYERPPTDWSTDPIEAGTDRIHQKIASVLKRLSKPAPKPLDKSQTDIGSVLEAALPWEDDDEEDKDDNKPKDTKGSDGSEHGGHSRAKHLAKQAIPKEKEEVKEGQDDLDRILTIMNHRR